MQIELNKIKYFAIGLLKTDLKFKLIYNNVLWLGVDMHWGVCKMYKKKKLIKKLNVCRVINYAKFGPAK